METLYVIFAVIVFIGSVYVTLRYPPSPDIYEGYLGFYRSDDDDIPPSDDATAKGSLPSSLDRDTTRN